MQCSCPAAQVVLIQLVCFGVVAGASLQDKKLHTWTVPPLNYSLSAVVRMKSPHHVVVIDH